MDKIEKAMKEINLSNWQVIKNDFPELINNFHDTFLSEDLFQIEQNDYIIDTGWYAHSNSFGTYLIYKYDWENPLIHIVNHSISDCLNAINLIIKYVENSTMNNTIKTKQAEIIEINSVGKRPTK